MACIYVQKAVAVLSKITANAVTNIPSGFDEQSSLLISSNALSGSAFSVIFRG